MLARASLSRLLACAAVASAVGAGACSLLLDNSPIQCNTTADCLARGAAFVGSFCTERHACEVTCTTNSECSAGSGQPSICRADRTCATLTSDDCKTLIADPVDLADSQTLWFGMLAPLDSVHGIFNVAKENAAELARREFNLVAGGLPALTEGGPRRRFAFVVCDDSVNADRAARHLADDVGVPAIIGPVFSDTLIRVATEVTIQRGVLLISPAATSPFITNLANKNGLIWRTAPSDTVQSIAIALLMESVVEPAAKRSEPLRVDVVYKGDAYGVGLADVLFDRLRFNGKSAAENVNQSSYREVDYGTPDTETDASAGAAYEHVLDDLASFAPHVVILAATIEAIPNIVTPLESSRWAVPEFRPHYVMTDGVYPNTALLAAVGGNTDLRKRILGTVPGTNSQLYQRFLDTYGSVFHDATQAIQSTAATYDAAYLLAYATASLGAAPITGASLNEGLKKMVPPGERIDVGPENINEALTILTTGGNIDFNGASGPLDFDVTTGEAEGDIQVWCLGADAKGNAASFLISGLSYSASTKGLVGQLVCP